MKAIIGKKLGMTQIPSKTDGNIVVSIVEVEPISVAQVKTEQSDGYDAIQVSYGQKKNISKSVLGHLKKAKIENSRIIKEFRLDDSEKFKIGNQLKIDQFKQGDKVKIIATSKGKGFSGTVKRHNFRIGPMSHGSNNHRQPGSIGATTPQHVIKGRRMSGRMGNDRITLKDIEIIDVLESDNILLLKGSLPGANGTIITITTDK